MMLICMILVFLGGMATTYYLLIPSPPPKWVQVPPDPPLTIPWTPLKVYGVKDMSVFGASAQEVEVAAHLAVDCINQYTNLGPFIVPFLQDSKIIVRPEDQWVDSWGRTVCGLAHLSWVEVDCNLVALCHELIHVIEIRITKAVNVKHTDWEESGYNTASLEYVKRLRELKNAKGAL